MLGADPSVPLVQCARDRPQCSSSAVSRGRLLSTYLHVEDAGYADGAADAIEAEGCNVWVITVLQSDTERCHEGGPRHLETNTLLRLTLNAAMKGVHDIWKQIHCSD